MGGSLNWSALRVPVLLAVTSLATVLIVGSSASAAPGNPRVVNNGVHRVTAAQRAATRAFWTPQRMAAAKPYPMPKGVGNPGVHTSTAAPTGKAGAVVGRAPSGAGKGAQGSARSGQTVGTRGTPTPAVNNYPIRSRTRGTSSTRSSTRATIPTPRSASCSSDRRARRPA